MYPCCNSVISLFAHHLTQLSDIVVPAANLKQIQELAEGFKRPVEAQLPLTFYGAETVLDALPHLFQGFD